MAALQGTAQGGKRYRMAQEAGAELRGAKCEGGAEAGMEPKLWPADGVRPVKLYRGGHSRSDAVNDNGNGVVGSTTGGQAATLPGAPSV